MNDWLADACIKPSAYGKKNRSRNLAAWDGASICTATRPSATRAPTRQPSGGAAPGTLHRLGPDDVALRPADGGAHLTSVLEARRFLPPDGTWPEIEVLGVEPQVLDYGLELSPSVAAALPALEAAARRIICDWAERSSPSEPIQAAS